MSREPRLLLWLPASLLSPSRAGQLQTFQTQRTWGEGMRGEAGSSQHSLTLSLASLYPQALLLLGLNPISASFQDQHCESLSLASNVSGESPSPSRARFLVSAAPSPGSPRACAQSQAPRQEEQRGFLSQTCAVHQISTEYSSSGGSRSRGKWGGKESCRQVTASPTGWATGRSHPSPCCENRRSRGPGCDSGTRGEEGLPSSAAKNAQRAPLSGANYASGTVGGIGDILTQFSFTPKEAEAQRKKTSKSWSQDLSLGSLALSLLHRKYCITTNITNILHMHTICKVLL